MQVGPHVTRQHFVVILLALMWIALAARLGVIQLTEHDGYQARVRDQRMEPFVIEAQRGCIMDRNGEKLAASMASASYGILPRNIKNLGETVRLLAEATGKSQSYIRKMCTSKENFVWLVRQPDSSVMRKLDSLDLHGLSVHPEFKRYYPLSGVGAQIIGITDIDGNGIEGCELFLNDDLSGRDGRSTLLRDGKNQLKKSLEEPIVKPQDGLDVVLTIDWRLQEIAEEELDSCLVKTNAQWGGAIILDAMTGEILAMANVPKFDPNKSITFSKTPGYMRNRLVTDMIEPGSTFKIVTFAEALESGKIKENDLVDCENGKYKIFKHEINDSHKLGIVPACDVFIHSSNIGAVKIADMIGKKNLYERARRFGFGEVIGSDFPYETPGRLPNPREWSGLSLPTISFGQGVAVSPLQMVMAYGAIANGGELMTSRIVKEIRSKGERAGRSTEPEKIRSAMLPETSRRLTEMLVRVVEEGTGKNAAVPHVRIAGKTGTAQKVRTDANGYSSRDYISSFIGFVENRDPKIVCLVMIDSPKGDYYASQIAAPVFKNIINRMINMNGNPWESMPVERNDDTGVKTVKVPDIKGKDVRTAVEKLRKLGLNPVLSGDSTVVAQQIPLPGATLNAGSDITLYSDAITTAKAGLIMVPDLVGKSLREAVQDLVQAKLEVTINGSGIVTLQKPQAGVYVNYGTVCMIACNKK